MSAILNPTPQPVPPPSKPVPVVAEPPSPSRRPWWLLVLAIIGGVAAWQYSARQQAADKAATTVTFRTAKVTQGPLEIRMRIVGQTSARDFANIIVPRMMGPEGNRPLMLEKLAKPGSLVGKDQFVVQIDAQSLIDHVDDVHSTVMQAESDVKKRQAELAIEMSNLQQTQRIAQATFDKAKLDRSTTPVRTPVDQELLQLTVDEAEANSAEIRTDLRNKAESQQSDLEILNFTLLRHTRHRDRHKKDVTRFTINAPMPGLVVMQTVFQGSEFRQIQEGDQVYSGQSVLKIVSPNSMQVEATVSQADSDRFRVGQVARITLDAFPGLELKGRVYAMGAIAVAGMRSSSNYLRSVPVRLMIEGTDPRLIPDLSAAADVLLERKDNQILVPRSALVEEGGKLFAYVKSAGNKFEKRPVAVSVQSYTEASILSGLKPGEEVALNYRPILAAR